MLGGLLRRYRHSALSTAQFQEMAARYLPAGAPDPKLEAFFENWVYGTGIPSLKLESAVRGKAPALRLEVTVHQSGVDDNFTAYVPIEVQTRGAKPATYWVRAESDPVTLTIPIKQSPTAVLLDPADSVLAVKR